jgi:hypothetical protein
MQYKYWDLPPGRASFVNSLAQHSQSLAQGFLGHGQRRGDFDGLAPRPHRREKEQTFVKAPLDYVVRQRRVRLFFSGLHDLPVCVLVIEPGGNWSMISARPITAESGSELLMPLPQQIKSDVTSVCG